MWLQVITSTQDVNAVVSPNGKVMYGSISNPLKHLSYICINYKCVYIRGVRMNEGACFAGRWV